MKVYADKEFIKIFISTGWKFIGTGGHVDVFDVSRATTWRIRWMKGEENVSIFCY
jgi:hypothetical protein